MRTRMSFLALAALIAACGQGLTDPDGPAGLLPSFSFDVEAQEGVSLTPSAVATGVDVGPQDGVYDAFAEDNLGSVNNNGYTSFGTALEFDLSSIPQGASVTGAQLGFTLNAFEGPRTVEVHGYGGDGAVQLADIASIDLLQSLPVEGTGAQPVMIDVGSAVSTLIMDGETHLGIAVREEPPNGANYTVMDLELASITLSITYASELLVEIAVKPSSDGAPVSLRERGRIPVAILSSARFDAALEVDRSSLTFGATGTEASLVSCGGDESDIDGDQLVDLVCHFDAARSGLSPGDALVVLRGQTLDGVSFRGVSPIRLLE